MYYVFEGDVLARYTGTEKLNPEELLIPASHYDYDDESVWTDSKLKQEAALVCESGAEYDGDAFAAIEVEIQRRAGALSVPEFDCRKDLEACFKQFRPNTASDVLRVISSRRSHRAYTDRQLPERVLSAILRAGLESPSARNRQPWHFSVVQDAALIQDVHDEAAEVMGGDRFTNPDFQIFYHAPTVVFLFGEKDFAWTQVDCGIAVENMVLAAEGLGVGSVILGLPKPAFAGGKADELRKRLMCPEGYDFVIALALGYAAGTKEPHDLRQEKISRIPASR